MTSVAASGVFNALAFAGAGYLFKMIDKGGYEKELRRHNRAMEKLAGAKEKWYENEIAQKNKIAELRRQLSDANADINTTNKALDALRRVTYEDKRFTREPEISDYYNPSDEMTENRYITIGISGMLGGWGVYKLLL
jgi:multidrug resistance efflux pump